MQPLLHADDTVELLQRSGKGVVSIEIRRGDGGDGVESPDRLDQEFEPCFSTKRLEQIACGAVEVQADADDKLTTGCASSAHDAEQGSIE